MKTPTACTDDVTGDPSYQTGQEVSVEDMQAAAQTQDLQSDAERFMPDRRLPPAAAAPNAAGDRRGAGGQDTIVITGSSGIIKATGLAGALHPGVNLQIGHTNHMTVYQGRDGSSYAQNAAPQNIPNRLKITDSQAMPQDHHLREVSKEMAGEWRHLGRRLQLTDAVLDQLNLDYGMLGLLEVNHQVLRKWMETCYPATLHALAKALADIGRGDLADKLSQMS